VIILRNSEVDSEMIIRTQSKAVGLMWGLAKHALPACDHSMGNALTSLI
jgi:hypothetical protein